MRPLPVTEVDALIGSIVPPVQPSPPIRPEQALCLAILDDAIALAIGTGSNMATRASNRLHVLEATRWIRRRGDQASRFSFDYVCQALGLEVEHTRRAILSMPEGSYRALQVTNSGTKARVRRYAG